MSRTDFEPLELELDWYTDERETLPSIDGHVSVTATLLPPASGAEWVRLTDLAEGEAWGLEWVEDINETPNMFGDHEGTTEAETPDAKRGDTMRAAPPPPSDGPTAPCSVTVPRLGRQRRQELIREAVSVVTLLARRRAG
jgi:hypothetical protein